MKILYSYFALMQRIGGVSRYYYENITRIEKECDVNVCMLFLSNEYFKRRLHRIWFNPKNQWIIYIRLVLEECFLWLNLKFTRYDVVHLTAERLSAFRWTRKPIVITVHDMIPELFSYSTKVVERRKYAIHHASHIICVSENTRKDLLKIYPEIAEERVSVIYHGHSSVSCRYERNIQDRYLLYVGSRTEQYKNFDRMLKAVAPILKNEDMKLVCTGDSFNQSEKVLIQELNMADNIINVGYVDDLSLASLYHFAECFVYPSLYEGFGIPILEAWTHKCPACISRSSCFPEIGGDAVEYFDAESVDSIRAAIEMILSDMDRKRDLVQKGEKRLKNFTWDKAAQAHLNLYRSLMHDSLQKPRNHSAVKPSSVE